jgi:hypothetical protein
MRITELQLRKIVKSLMREQVSRQVKPLEFQKMGLLPLEIFDVEDSDPSEDEAEPRAAGHREGEATQRVRSYSEPGDYNYNNNHVVVRTLEDEIFILAPPLFEQCGLAAQNASVTAAMDSLEAAGYSPNAGMPVPFSNRGDSLSDAACEFINYYCKRMGIPTVKNLGWTPRAAVKSSPRYS